MKITLSRICLVCPRGCHLNPLPEPELTEQKLCKRGELFLKAELNEPRRHFFSTLRDKNGNLIPYRTLHPISLSEIKDFIEKLVRANNSKERGDLHEEFSKTHEVLVLSKKALTDPKKKGRINLETRKL